MMISARLRFLRNKRQNRWALTAEEVDLDLAEGSHRLTFLVDRRARGDAALVAEWLPVKASTGRVRQGPVRIPRQGRAAPPGEDPKTPAHFQQIFVTMHPNPRIDDDRESVLDACRSTQPEKTSGADR